MTTMTRRKSQRTPPPAPGRVCSICGHVYPVCRNLYLFEHEFISLTAARRARHDEQNAQETGRAWIEWTRELLQQIKDNEDS